MKLVSWNVNGLRAIYKKGFEESFKELDADIFCIQETKMQEGQIELDLQGYYQYYNYAERKGYSGTAIFTKKEPLKVSYGIGIEEHDKEGRVITLEFDKFYMVNCYTPNSGRELARLEYRMTWEDEFTDEERSKIEELLNSGFTDSFRKMYPDKEGAYTWWSYMFNARANNAGWRIDYFLVSDRISKNIKDAYIYSEIMGSDHCPVGLEIEE